MTVEQWRAGCDRGTVDSRSCQGDSGEQVMTGEQWRVGYGRGQWGAGCDRGAVEGRL